MIPNNIAGHTKFDVGFVNTYKLVFDKSNNDRVGFGSGFASINSSDFILEIEYSGLTASGVNEFIMVQSRASSASDRWFIWKNTSNEILFRQGVASSAEIKMSFQASGTLRIVGNSGSFEMFHNDVLQATGSWTPTAINPSYLFNIACNNDSTGTSQAVGSSQSSITIHWFKITNGGILEIVGINEGSGATVAGDISLSGTIQTSNVGGLTYINNVMWQLE